MTATAWWCLGSFWLGSVTSGLLVAGGIRAERADKNEEGER